jgi:hypothetical protein
MYYIVIDNISIHFLLFIEILILIDFSCIGFLGYIFFGCFVSTLNYILLNNPNQKYGYRATIGGNMG